MDTEDDVQMLQMWGLIFVITFFSGYAALFFLLFGFGSFVYMVAVKSFHIYEAYLQHQEEKAKRHRKRIEP